MGLVCRCEFCVLLPDGRGSAPSGHRRWHRKGRLHQIHLQPSSGHRSRWYVTDGSSVSFPEFTWRVWRAPKIEWKNNHRNTHGYIYLIYIDGNNETPCYINPDLWPVFFFIFISIVEPKTNLHSWVGNPTLTDASSLQTAASFLLLWSEWNATLHGCLSMSVQSEGFSCSLTDRSVSGPIEQLPDYQNIRSGMFWMRSWERRLQRSSNKQYLSQIFLL